LYLKYKFIFVNKRPVPQFFPFI